MSILRLLLVVTAILFSLAGAAPLPNDCKCGVSRFPQYVTFAKTLENIITTPRLVPYDVDENDVWPTPINAADLPLSTAELMRLRESIQEVQTPIRILLPTTSLPSAPSGTVVPTSASRSEPICRMELARGENERLTWIVAFVILGLILLFLVAVSIVEITEELWKRWEGIAFPKQGHVRLSGAEKRLFAVPTRPRKLSTIQEKDELFLE